MQALKRPAPDWSPINLIDIHDATKKLFLFKINIPGSWFFFAGFGNGGKEPVHCFEIGLEIWLDLGMVEKVLNRGLEFLAQNWLRWQIWIIFPTFQYFWLELMLGKFLFWVKKLMNSRMTFDCIGNKYIWSRFSFCWTSYCQQAIFHPIFWMHFTEFPFAFNNFDRNLVRGCCYFWRVDFFFKQNIFCKQTWISFTIVQSETELKFFQIISNGLGWKTFSWPFKI